MILETIIIGALISGTAITLGTLWFADRFIRTPDEIRYEDQKRILERARWDSDYRLNNSTTKEAAQSWLKERGRLDQELLKLADEMRKKE
jgi:hypothetical protein